MCTDRTICTRPRSRFGLTRYSTSPGQSGTVACRRSTLSRDDQAAPSSGGRGHPRRRLKPHMRRPSRRFELQLQGVGATTYYVLTGDPQYPYANFSGTGNTLHTGLSGNSSSFWHPSGGSIASVRRVAPQTRSAVPAAIWMSCLDEGEALSRIAIEIETQSQVDCD